MEPAPRVTSDRFWEEERLVSRTGPDAEALQTYFQGIAARLFPNHDFTTHPVDFLLADRKEANAFFLEKDKAGNAHDIFVVTKGVFQSGIVENEDELAGIIGHEMAHFGLVQDLGSGDNSLGEERIADIEGAVKRMGAAGYNVERIRTLMEKIGGNHSFASELQRAFDVHGTNSTRLQDISGKISLLINDLGTKINKSQDMPLPANQPWKRMRHEGHFDYLMAKTAFRVRSLDGKLALLNEWMPECTTELRNDVYFHLLRDTLKRGNYTDGPWYETLSNTAFALEKGVNYYVQSALKQSHGTGNTPHNLVMREVAGAMQRFIDAEDASSARMHARTFYRLMQIHHLDTNDAFHKGNAKRLFAPLPQFSLPSEKKAQGQTLSWQRHKLWASEEPEDAPLISAMLDAMNVNDVREPDIDLQEKALKASNPEIHRFDFIRAHNAVMKNASMIESADGKTIHDYVVNGQGLITSTDARERDAQRTRDDDEIRKKQYRQEKADQAVKFRAAAERLRHFPYTDPGQVVADWADMRKTIEIRRSGREYMDWAKSRTVLSDGHFETRDTRHSRKKNKGVELDNHSYKMRVDVVARQKLIPLRALYERRYLEVADKALSTEMDTEKRQQLIEGIRDELNHGHASHAKIAFCYRHPEIMTVFTGRGEHGIGSLADASMTKYALDKKEIVKEMTTTWRNHRKGRGIPAGYAPAMVLKAREVLDLIPPHSQQKLEWYIDLHFANDRYEGARRDEYRQKWLRLELQLYLMDPKHHDFDILRILPQFERDGKLRYDSDVPNQQMFAETLDEFMARNDAWPKEMSRLIATYKYLEKQSLFSPHRPAQTTLLARIAYEIGDEPDRQTRIALIEQTLAGQAIVDPRIRHQLVDEWVKEQYAVFGKDDRSSAMFQHAEAVVHRLRDGEINLSDRTKMLRDLSDKMQVQPALAEVFSVPALVSRDELIEKSKLGKIAEIVSTAATASPERGRATLDYIISPGQMQDTSQLASELRPKTDEEKAAAGRSDVREKHPEQFLNNEKLKLYYDSFWTSDLGGRTYAVNRLLNSIAAGDAREDHKKTPHWQRSLKLVEHKIIQGDGEIEQSARRALSAYTEALSESQRSYFLSAVLCAAQNNGRQQNAMEVVGKGLAMFCALMGPAEIKLGQAINSATNIPNWMREGMSGLKGDAAPPALWEVDEWIANDVPKALRDQIVHRGPIVGSGSYYVIVAAEKADGTKGVLRLLRPHALERAEEGFRRLQETAVALSQMEKGSSDALIKKQLQQMSRMLGQMVSQASRMAEFETDLEYGARQVQEAHKMYDGTAIQADGFEFTFRVVPWKSYGERFAEMEWAEGVKLDDLPANSAHDLNFKRAASKALLAMEMTHILSGGNFDHDRHIKQQNIRIDPNDPHKAEILIYDTGALMLRDRNEKVGDSLRERLSHSLENLRDKTLLTDLLFGMAEAAKGRKGKEPAAYMMDYLGKLENPLYKSLLHSDYLVEFQKACLALGDIVEFQKEKHDAKGALISQAASLSAEDVKEVVQSVVKQTEIDATVKNTFVAKYAQRSYRQLKDKALEQTKFLVVAVPGPLPLKPISNDQSVPTETSSTGLTIQKHPVPPVTPPIRYTPDAKTDPKEKQNYIIDKKYVRLPANGSSGQSPKPWRHAHLSREAHNAAHTL